MAENNIPRGYALNVFEAVDRTGSITRTAAERSVTQTPCASRGLMPEGAESYVKGWFGPIFAAVVCRRSALKRRRAQRDR